MNEHELVRAVVCFGLFGVLVVHRLHERLPVVVSPDVHGREVGQQLVSQPEEVLHDLLGGRGEAPRLLGVERAEARVQSVHW